MRRSALERRVRILEGRIASLDPALTIDFERADLHTEAEVASEFSRRVVKAVQWGSVALSGVSLIGAVVTLVLT
jgi:hypothetical protein